LRRFQKTVGVEAEVTPGGRQECKKLPRQTYVPCNVVAMHVKAVR